MRPISLVVTDGKQVDSKESPVIWQRLSPNHQSEKGVRLAQRYKLAHAFLWEYSYKRLKLAQLLGQLGFSLAQGPTTSLLVEDEPCFGPAHAISNAAVPVPRRPANPSLRSVASAKEELRAPLCAA